MAMTEEEFLALPQGEGFKAVTFVLPQAMLVEDPTSGIKGPCFYVVMNGQRETILMSEETAHDWIHALGGHFPECHPDNEHEGKGGALSREEWFKKLDLAGSPGESTDRRMLAMGWGSGVYIVENVNGVRRQLQANIPDGMTLNEFAELLEAELDPDLEVDE